MLRYTRTKEDTDTSGGNMKCTLSSLIDTIPLRDDSIVWHRYVTNLITRVRAQVFKLEHLRPCVKKTTYI